MSTPGLQQTPPAAAILGIGASSPIGYGIRPIQAAMAGGLRNFKEATFLNGYGEPARISALPEVEELVPRAARIAVLTRLAVADLLDNLAGWTPSANIPIFVGVAHESPEADLAAIGPALAKQSGGLFDPDKSDFVGYRGGRIAFLAALSKAIGSFDTGSHDYALVVAVDTRCTWDCVDALIRNRRLLTSRDDGTIPGEAAVVALISSPCLQHHAALLVCDPTFGEDDSESLRCRPQASEGLGKALRSLRADPLASAARPMSVLGFGSGELCFSRAFVTAYLRNAQLMPEPLRHELLASNLGDVGAAAAGMALVRAGWLVGQPDSATDARVLIYGHADSGRCAATMAVRPPAQGAAP